MSAIEIERERKTAAGRNFKKTREISLLTVAASNVPA